MSFGGMEDFPLEMPGIARVTGPTYFGQTMEQGLNPSLQATSYSDVLASFAAEWPQPAPANNVATTWPEPGTLLDRSSMEHGSRQESLHAGSLGSPTVDFLAGSMAMDAGSAHGGTFFSQGLGHQELFNMEESDGESDKGPPAKPDAKGRGKAPASSGRTRRREKDRIAELEKAVQAAVEEFNRVNQQNKKVAAQLQVKDEELRKMRAAEDNSGLSSLEDEQLAASFDGHITLSVKEGRTIMLSTQQLKSLGEPEMREIWHEYVLRLRLLLETAHGPLPLNASATIRTLQGEALFLAAISNLLVMKRLAARSSLQNGNSSEMGHWQRVAEAMQLDGLQKGHVARLWQLLHDRVQKLVADRTGLFAQIKGTMPNGILGRDFAINFLKAYEVMDEVGHNMRQEHILLCDFAANFHKALGPVQNARCIVDAWPALPDTPALATCIAAMCNLPDAVDMLKRM